jgi:hypothetical protein
MLNISDHRKVSHIINPIDIGIYLRIHDNNLLKEIDCTYSNSKTLYHITNIINHLDDYKVEIKLNESILGKEYTGKFNDLGIKYIGLEKGIENVYNKLKNDKTNYILYPNS